MRKILSLFMLTVLCLGHLAAQVMVQGQSHPRAKEVKTKTNAQLKGSQSFTFNDVKFWVGTGSNRAALVIEWHDGNSPDALVWGYRWDGEASGHDMITAIAIADPRLLLLTQQTGSMGYTICGIGYSEQTLDIRYDLNGARTESHNAFKFELPITNSLLGQVSVPTNPAGDVASAISNGKQTGIIYHPLNEKVYGYPSYDYDYWICNTNNNHWKAGWYQGYWSYFVRGSQAENFSYSGLGATSRKLTDGCWDAWSWNGNMSTQEGTSPGDVFIAAPSSGGNPSQPGEPEKPVISVTNIKITPVTLRLQAGSEGKLAPSISPVNADNKSISWISSDPTIATVKEGNVTGILPGTAKITAKTTDGGYTAVCEVTVTNKVTPTLEFQGTSARLTFPKVENATSYEVRVYKYENGKYTKTATYVADAAGSIITEIGTKSLLSETGSITISLKNMDDKNTYTIEIQIMNGLDVLDTFRTEKTSGSVDNENITLSFCRAYYVNGSLYLENLEGYHFQLYTIGGKRIKSFTTKGCTELHTISLPAGIYILTGKKGSNKQTFKIQVNH